MAHHLVGQQAARAVAHNLVDPDDDFSVGARGEVPRLDMRIDHRPLTGPVAADAFASMHVAAVLAIRPHDVSVQGNKDPFDVTGIEALVNTLDKFHIAGHRPSHSSLMLAAAATAFQRTVSRAIRSRYSSGVVLRGSTAMASIAFFTSSSVRI